jgi:quercetin dioxygenase-like cupin family protein
MRWLHVCGVAAMISVAALIQGWAQDDELAAEGRGLLPEPTDIPATLGGTPPAHPFVIEPSGVFSRTVFQTDEDPNFKITIVDYSFPPDGQAHAITLASGALLHLRDELPEIGIAGERLALTSGARTRRSRLHAGTVREPTMTRIAIGTAAAALAALSATPFAQGVAQTLEPRPVFEATLAAPVKNGAAQPANISIQSWELPNQEGAAHEIPLRGFYVAHLLSGDVSVTVDGQTAAYVPGDYWAVKPGATMQVKVLSELAVLETIVAAKP